MKEVTTVDERIETVLYTYETLFNKLKDGHSMKETRMVALRLTEIVLSPLVLHDTPT